MATLREKILEISNLPSGNSIRAHLNSSKANEAVAFLFEPVDITVDFVEAIDVDVEIETVDIYIDTIDVEVNVDIIESEIDVGITEIDICLS